MKVKHQVIYLAKAMLQITLHCNISQETAFFINSTVETSNHKCNVMESNERAEISKYYAAHTSNFKPATILLHTLIWLIHVLILQVAIFPWCFSKFYEPGHYLFFPCIWLTTLPHSCAKCLENWEPQLPGNLWACPGL